jgi:hypothetical protein
MTEQIPLAAGSYWVQVGDKWRAAEWVPSRFLGGGYWYVAGYGAGGRGLLSGELAAIGPRIPDPPTGPVNPRERSNAESSPETLSTWAAGLSLAEVSQIECDAFIRGREAGKKLAELESKYGSFSPPSPAAVVDYAERARVAISELVLCHGFGFHANCLEEAEKALAKRFSAIASEHQAEIAALRHDIERYQAIASSEAEGHSAALARLREPDPAFKTARWGAIDENGNFVELPAGGDWHDHPLADKARWIGGAQDYELARAVLKAATPPSPGSRRC